MNNYRLLITPPFADSLGYLSFHVLYGTAPQSGRIALILKLDSFKKQVVLTDDGDTEQELMRTAMARGFTVIDEHAVAAMDYLVSRKHAAKIA